MVPTITGSTTFERLFVKGLYYMSNFGEFGQMQSSTAVQVVLSEIHILIVISLFSWSYLLNTNLLDLIFDYFVFE